MKTILFVSYNELNITWGGIHRVNKLLMEGFSKVGYNCLYLINKEGHRFYINNKETEENEISKGELKHYLLDRHVDVIIDQEAIFTDSFALVFKSLGLAHIKFLSVFHNTPSIYEKIYGFRWLVSKINETQGVKNKSLYILRFLGYPIWRFYTFNKISRQYWNIYENSDRCVMLSRNDIPTLAKYLSGLSMEKCVTIPNALTFDETSDESILKRKEKNVLIVSRLNDDEKRISLALRIWKILEDKGFDDWTLTIVGAGPHADKLQLLARKLKLKNVLFEGRQLSEPYYEKASLFMMTSAVEGWGLTITESMQRGVVPIVFNSYPALSDIITDGYDGCIIPNNDIQSFANSMSQLMENIDKRERIAINALKSCQRFRPDVVVEKWEKLIEHL